MLDVKYCQASHYKAYTLRKKGSLPVPVEELFWVPCGMVST
jgi:hypothetical protein